MLAERRCAQLLTFNSCKRQRRRWAPQTGHWAQFDGPIDPHSERRLNGMERVQDTAALLRTADRLLPPGRAWIHAIALCKCVTLSGHGLRRPEERRAMSRIYLYLSINRFIANFSSTEAGWIKFCLTALCRGGGGGRLDDLSFYRCAETAVDTQRRRFGCGCFIDLEPKIRIGTHVPPIASTRRGQSTIFYLGSSTTLRLETPGVVSTPASPRYEKWACRCEV